MTEEPPAPVPSRVEGAPNPVLSPIEGMRTFGLNSREFYEAVCEPIERPWIKAGSLPREPRGRERVVIVEHRVQGRRR